MESPARLFLIHRYRLLTDALKTSLADDSTIVLVGQTSDVREAFHRIADLVVDIVLIEASLDREGDRPVIRRLKSTFPRLRIIPIGLETNAEILECIEAGACGYLPQEATLSDLVKTVRLVAEGKSHCSPELAVSIFARIAELSRYGERRHHPSKARLYLTPREKQVLDLMAGGLRNKEIARDLGIAVPTVKNHVHKILDKLGVQRRRDAVRLAQDMGLLSSTTYPDRFRS